MKKLILVPILMLSLGCSQRLEDERILEFEKTLGERQTSALNLLVADFEKNLAMIYPNLSTEMGYQHYLQDMVSDSIQGFEQYKFMTKETINEYIESGLRDQVYKTSYLYDSDLNDTIEIIEANTNGNYMQALYSVKESDTLIKTYWEKREAAGMMRNEMVVNGILSCHPDFSDYFHKRIVVLEFSL